MSTLSQRLESFPTESMAEILPRCRRDYPLPPPINRGFVDDLSEEKIGSKVGHKPALLPPFLQFFFTLSLRCSSHQPKPPTAYTQPTPSLEATYQPPRATLNLYLSSLQLLVCLFLLLLPLPPATNSSIVHRKDAAWNISLTSWSRPWPQTLVASSSARQQLLQPFGCMQHVNSKCSRCCI